MYKVACTPKETSCLISNIFTEIRPVCSCCKDMQDDELVLRGTLHETGEEATIKITSYGFEFDGDAELIKEIKGKRCLYCSL